MSKIAEETPQHLLTRVSVTIHPRRETRSGGGKRWTLTLQPFLAKMRRFDQEHESRLPHRVNNRDVLQSAQHSLEEPPRDPILSQERPDALLDIHPLGRRNG